MLIILATQKIVIKSPRVHILYQPPKCSLSIKVVQLIFFQVMLYICQPSNCIINLSSSLKIMKCLIRVHNFYTNTWMAECKNQCFLFRRQLQQYNCPPWNQGSQTKQAILPCQIHATIYHRVAMLGFWSTYQSCEVLSSE